MILLEMTCCLSCFCCAYVHGFTIRIFSPAIAGHGQHPTSAWVVLPYQHITVVALMLQCYVRLSVAVCLSSSVRLCIVAKRCVLEQKLLLTAYRKEVVLWGIDWYQNKRRWPLFRGRIKIMSAIASHSPLNISETVRDWGLVPKDYQWEMAYGESNGNVTYSVTWPQKVKLVTPIRTEPNISGTVWDAVSNNR